MQMKDGLSAIRICIYYDAISVLGKSLFSRDLGGRQEYMSERCLVALVGRVERIDVFTRNDQNMRRCLRREVVERDAHFVFVDSCGWDLTRSQLAENAVGNLHIW